MISKIRSGMTPEPVSISHDFTLDEAREVMRSWGMRHLPVMAGEKVVGVITDRDILAAFAVKKPGSTLVSEAMSPEPYTVRPDTRVAEVAREMAENKFGCALVVDHGALVGIFTTVDALELLAKLLNEPAEVDYRTLHVMEYLNRTA